MPERGSGITESMQTIFLNHDAAPGFAAQLRAATALAGERLAEPMLLSWYDAARQLESPGGVSECGAAQPTDGVQAYARSRGAVLAVVFGEAIGTATLFCFADLAA